MVIDELLRGLIQSRNAAADEVLVDALRLGSATEQTVVLGALLARKSLSGLMGVVEHYDRLGQPLQVEVLQSIGEFHGAIREAGRSPNTARRLAAIKLIAHGRLGKLSFVLSENLHSGDEAWSKAAAGAMTALARWVWRSMRWLQRGDADDGGPLIGNEAELARTPDRASLYREVTSNRGEIEQAVVRALELHRGSRQQELLHAALMLCDSAASYAIRVLSTVKHGGQTAMLRRIQTTPDPEHVAAFLLGATHGGLRSQFGSAFGKIESPAALDQLLRRSHWLKDNALQLSMRQVTQCAWLSEIELAAELGRRPTRQIAHIAEWVGHTGTLESQQDPRLEKIHGGCGDDFDARLRVFRVIASRRLTQDVSLLRKLMHDSDPRIVRMCVREYIRRRPADLESTLLPLMSDAAPSVRDLVSRAIGQASFETFWDRFDQLEPAARKSAGRAMLKLLPDALQRLARRLGSGSPEQRIKALAVARELGLVIELRACILPLCTHANPKVRSRAVSLLGEFGATAVDVLITKAADDTDARVRANAIEVMERRRSTRFVPLLTQRALTGDNRERANAIKALHAMKVGIAGQQLLNMLRDQRADHRVSGLWLLRRIGWWRLLTEVARLARQDDNLRVRRYAVSVLETAQLELSPTG